MTQSLINILLVLSCVLIFIYFSISNPRLFVPGSRSNRSNRRFSYRHARRRFTNRLFSYNFLRGLLISVSVVFVFGVLYCYYPHQCFYHHSKHHSKHHSIKVLYSHKAVNNDVQVSKETSTMNMNDNTMNMNDNTMNTPDNTVNMNDAGDTNNVVYNGLAGFITIVFSNLWFYFYYRTCIRSRTYTASSDEITREILGSRVSNFFNTIFFNTINTVPHDPVTFRPLVVHPRPARPNNPLSRAFQAPLP